MQRNRLTIVDDQHFTQLLAQWNRHQDLRRSGRPVAELWESRTALDHTRRSRRV